jgi:hypothetical protein
MKQRELLIRKAIDALSGKFSDDDYSKVYVRDAIYSLNALKELNMSASEYAQRYSQKISSAMDLKMADDTDAGTWFDKVGNSVD